MKKIDFHPVDSNITGVTRARVPGGWVIRSTSTVDGGLSGGAGVGIGLAFVPDPEHKWI